MVYALEAATFATEYQLPDIEFAVNHYGQPDVAVSVNIITNSVFCSEIFLKYYKSVNGLYSQLQMFDFTAMYAAENACRVVQKKGHKLLMTLVGDSLLEVCN